MCWSHLYGSFCAIGVTVAADATGHWALRIGELSLIRNVSVPVRFLSTSHVFLGYNLIIVIHEPSRIMIQTVSIHFQINPLISLNHGELLLNFWSLVSPLKDSVLQLRPGWKYLWTSRLLFGGPPDCHCQYLNSQLLHYFCSSNN